MSYEKTRQDIPDTNYTDIGGYTVPYRGAESSEYPTHYPAQPSHQQQIHPDLNYAANVPQYQQEYAYGYTERRNESYLQNSGIGFQSSFQQFSHGRADFAGPIMTDVAMKYGSRFMDTGREIVDKEINKYMSLARLRYYFTVDTAYVLKKIQLILFPYYNQTWVPKYVRGQLALPKDDVNAPDLYIPMMAYITYVLLAGVVLGTKKQFSPEILGVLSSQALACVLIEIAVQMITIYISSLQTRFCTWDLLSLSGYKFVGIIVAVLMSNFFGRVGYNIGLIYCSISLAFYLMRILKWRMINEVTVYNPDTRSDVSVIDLHQGKRRLYLMISIVVSQPILMWWLSYNLDFELK